MFALVAIAGIATMFTEQAHASYKVEGSARITGASATTVAWECPPPNITCFTHGGPGSQPLAGQEIELHIGPNTYTLTLLSADAETGEYKGEFLEGVPPELELSAD